MVHDRDMQTSFPELVREFTVLEKYASRVDLSEKKSSCYADQYNLKYPIDTAANAVASKAYAIKVGEQAPHVLNAIDKALDIYGVPSPRRVQVKQANSFSEAVYLLPEQNLYPVKTASDIREADRALNRVHRKLSTESLARASSTLVKLAGHNKLNVSDRVMQWAGLKMCDIEKTASWIEARGAVTSTNVFYKLADKVRSSTGPKSRRDLTKLASAIEHLDKRYGLEKHYDTKLPNPLETVFSSKESMQKVIEHDGKHISLDKLMTLPISFYQDVLGEDIAEEITSNGELDPEKVSTILPTLPKDMISLLCKKMYQM